MEKCPCCSAKLYVDCCGPFLENKAKPLTAEALMRSRFTAYAKQNVDYIINTTHSAKRSKLNRKDIEEWAREAEFQKLEIIQKTDGERDNEQGRVIFRAFYKYHNKNNVLEEDSKFEKENGEWFYVDGKTPQQKPIVNKNSIGRNDPCFCGSGKKHKKCCG
jgi:SEC-C motif domain protein